MKYKFTSVIIILYIAFIFQSCVSVSNEKSVQDIWELQRLNTYWNKYNITYFTVSGKVCFDNEKGLEVITPDGFLVGSLDDAVCSEYIQKYVISMKHQIYAILHLQKRRWIFLSNRDR